MRTAVHVHGCHLSTIGWELIVLGDPGTGLLGQAAKGLDVAIQLGAEVMFWGTGSSERDGLKESRYTFECLRAIPDMAEKLGKFEHIFDEVSHNTRAELECTASRAFLRDIERLWLVSNPTHIARCINTALMVLQAEPRYDKLLRNIGVAVSDVCYPGKTPNDVIIIDPPHRLDQPRHNMNGIAKAMIGLRGTPQANFCLTELRATLGKYGADI